MASPQALPSPGRQLPLRGPSTSPSVLREVRELVTQGSLPQAQLAAADPKTQALKELTRLHGVGAATAAAWCTRSVFSNVLGCFAVMFSCFRW